MVHKRVTPFFPKIKILMLIKSKSFCSNVIERSVLIDKDSVRDDDLLILHKETAQQHGFLEFYAS